MTCGREFVWACSERLAGPEVAQGILTESRWREVLFFFFKFSLFGRVAGQGGRIRSRPPPFFKTLFKRSFRFTAKLKERSRNFLYTPPE